MQSSDLVPIFENIRTRAKSAGMDGTREQLYNFFMLEVRVLECWCGRPALSRYGDPGSKARLVG